MDINFNVTGVMFLAMLGYGLISLLFDKISFDFRIAGAGILFIFIIEIIALLISISCNKKKK